MRENKRRYSKSGRSHCGIIAVTVLIFSIFAVSGIFYLSLGKSIKETNKDINNCEKRIESLRDDIKRANVRWADCKKALPVALRKHGLDMDNADAAGGRNAVVYFDESLKPKPFGATTVLPVTEYGFVKFTSNNR